ncbi:transposase family protein [Paenibacillus sp. FSL K6-2859]|uniref:transposase family protein n=1 Tax=Paenibacillus sp. FSL K6-2859 TaxID=2921482 RepID=UPI0030F8559E
MKRDGRNKSRKIRHVSIFGKKCFLHIPSLRLACSRCKIGFVWSYAWVGPKEQYSRLFPLTDCKPGTGLHGSA